MVLRSWGSICVLLGVCWGVGFSRFWFCCLWCVFCVWCEIVGNRSCFSVSLGWPLFASAILVYVPALPVSRSLLDFSACASFMLLFCLRIADRFMSICFVFYRFDGAFPRRYSAGFVVHPPGLGSALSVLLPSRRARNLPCSSVLTPRFTTPSAHSLLSCHVSSPSLSAHLPFLPCTREPNVTGRTLSLAQSLPSRLPL